MKDSGWISTDVCLPQEDVFVLYCVAGSTGSGPRMWIGQCCEGVFYSRSGDFNIDNVTHWRYLPELPEKD